MNDYWQLDALLLISVAYKEMSNIFLQFNGLM